MTDSLLPPDAHRDTRKNRLLASVAVGGLVLLALAGGLWWQGAFTDAPATLATSPADVAWNDPNALKPALQQSLDGKLAGLRFTAPDGRTVALADYAGKPVVLNFWATWCPPCVKEMPDLDALAGAIAPHGGVVLAVSVNATAAEAQDWLDAHQLARVQLLMDAGGKHFATLPSAGLPLTLLIRPDGTLAERLDGYQKWRDPKTLEKISALVAGGR